ncbi:putative protein [Arabidopsis thaliana]|uniref:Putative two-component response regulator ARR20 n=1 Tax=Arabidopsis thaliana TaxID=3702 RepID=ARR20_ARATH|nr:two-component response regulator [Arabidopsis thaliana]Q9LZJ8.1 RecName: Full=Putative two-component response regulator ARR20 [Arabidopsis thaliana]AEE80378.2 two-component response regulator [Arabidopsis thaliana]CAB83117.1 putative protein [Arabidopsis thaliana]|eukprot:NP_001319821.1 two-component response regulator [Arabidopsis thaliana]
MSVFSNILDENSRNLRNEIPCDDGIASPINDDDEEFLTKSNRVLLVGADSNSSLKNLMTQYSYQVTKYESGEEAMAFLMKNKHEIDLVIWDFHMPDINGLDALNIIGKQMDLPVVIMSHEYKKETVMESIKYGACDFLVKPVSKEVIAVLWRHVYRKRMSKSGLDKPGESGTVESDPDEYDDLEQDNLYESNEEGSKNTCDHKEEKSPTKKPRMQWTPELHHKFEVAVEKMGSLEKAFPKTILKYMQEELNVQGLTRNNVASHLQKYRQSSKKTCTPQEPQEDFVWGNAGPDVTLAASKTLLSSHATPSYLINNQAAPRGSYFMNNIPYPSTSCLPVNNNNCFMTNPSTYIDQFQHQLQQQQQHQQYQSTLNSISAMLTKQESRHVPSSAMENSEPLMIYNSNLPFGIDECFPPAGFNIFDQIGHN